MTTLFKEGLERPIESSRDLIDYLARGAKSRSEWGVGAESERLVIGGGSGEAAPFPAIERLLADLENGGPWQGIREEGRLIGLQGEHSSVTLEPGGQLELSGRLCANIHCCRIDLERHIDLTLAAGRRHALEFFGLGVHPFTPLEQIDWVPKARYGVMGPYMLRTGDMGQRMMKQTAGLQVNLDFGDEEDCIAKLRLCEALSPLLYALFANSPVMEGRPTGFLSTRGEIWSRTDPDRTGFIPGLHEEGAGYHTYVEYALDVPMYFIYRQGSLVDLTKARFPFRRFLTEGYAGHSATLADWDLHLSTLFPEVRLRPQVEIRSADSLPPRMILSVAALLKGVLYDSGAQQEAWELFRHQSDAERRDLLRSSWRLGLKAPAGEGTLQQLARKVLSIARAGLARQAALDDRGRDETFFLDEIEEIATSGVTLAERLLEGWKGDRAARIAHLRDHCAFGPRG